MRRSSAAALAVLLTGGIAFAQTETPTHPAAETAPQSSASTTVKPPAGVSQGNEAQKTMQGSDCKSASAEMTNGAVTSCKQ